MLQLGPIATYLEILTIVILGIFSFLTLLDRRQKEAYKEVIGNLKATVDSMSLRMGEMELELEERKKDHHESLEKIAHLNGENKVLRDLLLGNDPASKEYRDESLKLLRALVDELKHHDAFVRKAHPEVSLE